MNGFYWNDMWYILSLRNGEREENIVRFQIRNSETKTNETTVLNSFAILAVHSILS